MTSKLLFCFLLIFATVACGHDCFLSTALKNPSIRENAEFWEEYNSQGGSKISSGDLQRLIKKYGGEAIQPRALPDSRSMDVSFAARGEKEVSSLPEHLQDRVDKFLDIISEPGGLKKIRDHPASWHLEKTPQFGPGTFTVRLNDGYRLLFQLNEDGIKILRANKGQIHSN